MKKTLLLISCLAMVFLVHSAGADETKKFKDKQIEELSKKFFYYSSVDGKESLTLTAAPSTDWYDKASDDSCENTVVQLRSPRAALSIQGTSLILALLDCPASRDLYYDAVVAVFDGKSLEVPVCFAQLELMSEGRYYWGGIDAVEARDAGNGAYHIVVTLGGADGGDYWTSFLFLKVTLDCKMTLLSKLYASHGINHDSEHPGRKIEYKFVNDKTVEVTTNHLVLTDQFAEKVVKTTSKKYHLDELYINAKSRVFPSKAEKALALMKNGADVNSKDESGKTLLMLAAEDGSSGIVQQFLDKGADVDARSKDGYTALMAAAYGGNEEVMTMLLDKGADVNAKDENGWTALMSAARTGRRKAAKILLDRGADVNAKTKRGWTALKAAQQEDHADVVEFLKIRGAKE
jgi:hypothetical protein